MNPESIERMTKDFSQLGLAMGEAARSIIDVFSEIFKNAWESIKAVNILDKNISRKRFVNKKALSLT